MKLPQSKYFNLFNILFIKFYDLKKHNKKIIKERYLYYQILDKKTRNLTDYGLVIKLFDYYIWLRKWKKGFQIGNQILNNDELSTIVNKLIQIHALKIPARMSDKLSTIEDKLEWLDKEAGCSLLSEWKILNKTDPRYCCLVHGDFQPSKHIIKLGKRLEVIDFGCAFMGHPGVDLGALACSNPEIFKEIFLIYNKSVSDPVSIEIVNFWKKYFEISNIFWMNVKFNKQ